MKFKGDTVTITITLPRSKLADIEKLFCFHVDGFDLEVSSTYTERVERKNNSNRRDEIRTSIALIQQMAIELGVLEKSNKTQIVTVRTTLVYFLRKYYSGPLIALCFGWNDSNVIACSNRYERLKNYADYIQATEDVIQCLKRRSLVGFQL